MSVLPEVGIYTTCISSTYGRQKRVIDSPASRDVDDCEDPCRHWELIPESLKKW